MTSSGVCLDQSSSSLNSFALQVSHGMLTSLRLRPPVVSRIITMPLTRSASQKSLDTPSTTATDVVDNFSTTATPLRRNKRSLIDEQKTPLRTPTPRKKAKNAAATPGAAGAENTPAKPLPVFKLTDASQDPSRMIPGKLGFDFDQAKRHLIGVDQRFETLFSRLKCKPFENLEAVDPFRCAKLWSTRVSELTAIDDHLQITMHLYRRTASFVVGSEGNQPSLPSIV